MDGLYIWNGLGPARISFAFSPWLLMVDFEFNYDLTLRYPSGQSPQRTSISLSSHQLDQQSLLPLSFSLARLTFASSASLRFEHTATSRKDLMPLPSSRPRQRRRTATMNLCRAGIVLVTLTLAPAIL